MISFEIEGEKQLVRRFRGIQMAGRNWRPTMKKIGRDLTECFSGPVFETRGREIGEKWKTRKEPTGGWPLLERTGKMRKGFKYQAGKDKVEINNIVPYFIFHQSKQPRKTKLPRRVMMKLDNKRKQQIMKRFHLEIIQMLRGKSLWRI